MKQQKLTYPLICAAVNGEPQAQRAILTYYDAYINALSMEEKETEDGWVVRYVNEDTKTRIQRKLLEATRKWRAL